MKPTAEELAARVAAEKRPADAAPWMPAVRGPQHWLLLDEISMAALAEGIVLARVQRQARLAMGYMNGDSGGRRADPPQA